MISFLILKIICMVSLLNVIILGNLWLISNSSMDNPKDIILLSLCILVLLTCLILFFKTFKELINKLRGCQMKNKKEMG